MHVWIEVTQDKYELIINMADTAREMAKLAHVSKVYVEMSNQRYKKGLQRPRFINVQIDEEDEPL